jgi:hypothetical protein
MVDWRADNIRSAGLVSMEETDEGEAYATLNKYRVKWLPSILYSNANLIYKDKTKLFWEFINV